MAYVNRNWLKEPDQSGCVCSIGRKVENSRGRDGSLKKALLCVLKKGKHVPYIDRLRAHLHDPASPNARDQVVMIDSEKRHIIAHLPRLAAICEYRNARAYDDTCLCVRNNCTFRCADADLHLDMLPARQPCIHSIASKPLSSFQGSDSLCRQSSARTWLGVFHAAPSASIGAT